jgi:hypothetical protein
MGLSHGNGLMRRLKPSFRPGSCGRSLVGLLAIGALLSLAWSTSAAEPASVAKQVSVAKRVLAAEPTSPANAGSAEGKFPLIPDVTTPLNLKLLQPGAKPASGVITSQSMSATRLTIPSLWWTAEQIAADKKYTDKFLQGWIAYLTQNGEPGRVDLLVNRQIWTQMNYISRYEMINRFSTIARNYGFNIRVFSSQDVLSGAYTCDFSGINASALQVPATQSSNPYTRNAVADRILCKTLVQDGVRASDRELLR